MIPKFRAWHKTWKEMGKVTCIHFDDKQSVISMFCEEEQASSALLDDEVILMQSTGNTDENEKEIFEGDILAVETDDGTLNVNVFWDEGHALFMFESKQYNEKEALAELLEDDSYPFEIIGNIYENPELLEVEDE